MPRDSSGNYSLPAGNPVTAGTTIEVSWANPTFEDIRDALTDSLDRQGRGGMLAPFRFSDENKAAPSITWTNETTMGFYRAGTQDMRLAVSNVDRMRWINGRAQLWDVGSSMFIDIQGKNEPVPLKDGSTTEPSMTWANDLADGFYRNGTHDQRYVQDQSGAVEVFRILNAVFGLYYQPHDAGSPEWLDAIGTKLKTALLGTETGSEVASAAFVLNNLPVVAVGKGDGNSDTFVSDVRGVSSWDAGTGGSLGRYTMTLSSALSSVANAVVLATPEEDSDLSFTVKYRVTSTTEIIFETYRDGFGRNACDAVSFVVLDMDLLI